MQSKGQAQHKRKWDDVGQNPGGGSQEGFSHQDKQVLCLLPCKIGYGQFVSLCWQMRGKGLTIREVSPNPSSSGAEAGQEVWRNQAHLLEESSGRMKTCKGRCKTMEISVQL